MHLEVFKSTKDPFQSVFPKKALWPLDQF